MDAAIILIVALVCMLRCMQQVDNVEHSEYVQEAVSDVKRVAKTNDVYYHDDLAFTSISRALGFPKEEL